MVEIALKDKAGRLFPEPTRFRWYGELAVVY